MLKAIHASEDIVAAREKAVRVIEKLRGLRLNRAAELAEAAVEETLTYYAFPEEHWRRIRTNNPSVFRRAEIQYAFQDTAHLLGFGLVRSCGNTVSLKAAFVRAVLGAMLPDDTHADRGRSA